MLAALFFGVEYVLSGLFARGAWLQLAVAGHDRLDVLFVRLIEHLMYGIGFAYALVSGRHAVLSLLRVAGARGARRVAVWLCRRTASVETLACGGSGLAGSRCLCCG